MSLKKRSWLFVLTVLGLVALSGVAVLLKPTKLGLDLKGGAQAIYTAKPTTTAGITTESIDQTVEAIRDRVDAFGVAEPEIQKVGPDQILVALPDIEDPEIIDDLVQAAQVTFYAYELNLVGRVAGQDNPQNPAAGTPDLLSLLKLAQGTPKKAEAKGDKQVYLFRKDATNTYVAGPEPDEATLLRNLQKSADPAKTAVANEYTADKKKFDLQTLPAGFVILTNGETVERPIREVPRCGADGALCVLLHNVIGVPGQDISGANLGFDQGNNPVVEMQFRGDSFEKTTAAIARAGLVEGAVQRFGVSLDGVLISIPTINAEGDNPNGITGGQAQISGSFTEDSASTLAKQISSGALPLTLEQSSLTTVNARLGEASLKQALLASIIALIIVALALILYYRVLGIVAVLSLIVYGLYLFAVVKIVPVALTLPGMAGLILTIGVAADASVVIFERVREEARAGRPARVALLNGYKRGITAIIDANIVTLVTAIFIFLIGTAGPKGFAFMLILGVILSLFTAIILTQGLFGLLVETKLFQNERLMGFNAREIKWKMDIVGKWKLWLAIAFVPLIAGAAVIGVRGIERGLDLTGGTRITVAFTDQQPADDVVRNEVAAFGQPSAIVQRFESQDEPKTRGYEITTKNLTTAETTALLTQLETKFGPTDESVQQIETVGASFGNDVLRKAMWAIFFSFLAIIAYLALRFEWKLALAALVSVVHDVWLTLSIYSIAGKEVTSATVAALLTILGYSLYDVVIVFDRIRENVPLMRGRPYREIVNRSVHETLTRSIITFLLTVLPIIALLIFGGPSLFDFSFALAVGILAGGVSSIFISAPLAALWKEREPNQQKVAVRQAKKAARAATVDSDILDVDALNRAEAELAYVPPVDTGVGTAILEGPDGSDAQTPARPEPPPPDTDPDSEVPADGSDAAEKPSAPKPPQRQRRHQNVQRRRRK